jgi:predicted nucleotidyltransferase
MMGWKDWRPAVKTHATANTKRYQAKPRSRPSKRREVYWNWSKNGKADPTILAGIVKAVVRAAKPEKIVLFGSAARGEMGPNSDYDILVIKAGKFNFWRELTRIYKNLPGTAPVDVVLATPEVVEQYRDTHCLVYCPAMKEGKIIYDSKTLPAGGSARVVKSSAKQPRVRQNGRLRRVP